MHRPLCVKRFPITTLTFRASVKMISGTDFHSYPYLYLKKTGISRFVIALLYIRFPKRKATPYTSCSSKRNLNNAATRRDFMLSRVFLSICPFLMAAIRIRKDLIRIYGEIVCLYLHLWEYEYIVLMKKRVQTLYI